MAFFATRDAMPNATTQISASSVRYSPTSLLFALFFAYLSNLFEVALFEFFGHEIKGIDDIVLPLHLRSVVAHGLSNFFGSPNSRLTGSIIWPIVPSAKDHRSHSVFVRKVKALDRGQPFPELTRAQALSHAEVAVPACFRRHEIVGLRRLYSAETDRLFQR